MNQLARIDLICEQEELYTREEIVTTIRRIVAEGCGDAAQAAMTPAVWQYRVMFDKGHIRDDEWCEWRDAGKKYFDKVNAEIAAGATRVQTRVLYALSSTSRGTEA